MSVKLSAALGLLSLAALAVWAHGSAPATRALLEAARLLGAGLTFDQAAHIPFQIGSRLA